MNKKNLAKEFEDIVTAGLNSVHIPYQKGNSIRIGSIVIRKNKHGFLVIDLKEQKQITKTFFKTSAVALAKALTENRPGNNVEEIKKLDSMLLKHYNDAMFYNHTIKVTKDIFRREAIRSRYDLSLEHTRQIKNNLDCYIF